MKTLSQMMILILPLDGQYNGQRLTVTLNRPVDELIVVAAAQVALAAKIEVVETFQAKVVNMAEPDHHPRARTA